VKRHRVPLVGRRHAAPAHVFLAFASPAEFRKFIAEETEKWGKVIRAANIKAD
jgi:tripartite-type tricarboxylate transporter receptor subunit TctC